MNRYEKAHEKSEEDFVRLTGYSKKTMEKMLEILKAAYAAKHKRRGRHSKLEVADMLMLASKYWRECVVRDVFHQDFYRTRCVHSENS